MAVGLHNIILWRIGATPLEIIIELMPVLFQLHLVRLIRSVRLVRSHKSLNPFTQLVKLCIELNDLCLLNRICFQKLLIFVILLTHFIVKIKNLLILLSNLDIKVLIFFQKLLQVFSMLLEICVFILCKLRLRHTLLIHHINSVYMVLCHSN